MSFLKAVGEISSGGAGAEVAIGVVAFRQLHKARSETGTMKALS